MNTQGKWNVLQFIYKLEVGGAERVVCALATGLDKSRFNSFVASCKGGPLEEYLSQQRIPVYVLGKKGKLDLIFFIRLLRLLRNWNIHILQTHTFTPNLWGRIAAVLVRTPVIITTEHTIASHKNWWQRMLDKFLARFSKKIVAVSEEVRDSLVTLCRIDSSKLVVIHNGVHEKQGSPIGVHEMNGLKSALNIPASLPIVLSIGRLSPAKGHSYLLEAASAINKKKHRAYFLFAGDGPLRDELEYQAARLNLKGSVCFLGFRDDIRKLLLIADLVVFPSIREGFSIALLEAMAAAKPIIATDVGGNKEALTSGVSGLLIPPRNVEALTEAIMNILTNDEIASAFGNEAKKKFDSEFTLNKMIYNTEVLYANLIDKFF